MYCVCYLKFINVACQIFGTDEVVSKQIDFLARSLSVIQEIILSTGFEYMHSNQSPQQNIQDIILEVMQEIILSPGFEFMHSNQCPL